MFNFICSFRAIETLGFLFHTCLIWDKGALGIKDKKKTTNYVLQDSAAYKDWAALRHVSLPQGALSH